MASIWSTNLASLLVGQEHPHHLDDLLPGEHQPGVGAMRIELGQLLAQQRQQQADVEGQRPSGDKSGHVVGALVLGGMRRNA